MFDIDKNIKLGIGIFLAGTIFFSAIIAVLGNTDRFQVVSFGKPACLNEKVIEIPFDLAKGEVSLPMPDLEADLSFAFDRARPEQNRVEGFLVRLKKTNQVKSVKLPARLDFHYEKGLRFSEERGPFWAELEQVGQNQVRALVFVTIDHVQKSAGSFCFNVEEAPLRTDFQEGTPLKMLAESRLLGKDVFIKNYGDGVALHRLEIKGNATVTLNEGDFFSWENNKWVKIANAIDAKDGPLARVAKLDDKSVLFETWTLDGYSRISLSLAPKDPFKTKYDEFLSSVRIRSEKQISCMLDKQCFVLRVGDFVLKEENRWKILRKKEEKDAYIQGKLEGELFVFDRIDLKGGQKIVHGNLVNLARSQMLPVNVNAQLQRKASLPKEIEKKGKK